jgi:dUTP pyrophosphatase
MNVILLNDKAKLPTRGSELSAGLDLYCCEDIEVAPLKQSIISTGIAIQMDYDDAYARIAPRSGLAAKNGLIVNAGVIDKDYTGEIKVVVYNTNYMSHYFKTGDRIAQLIVEKIYYPEVTQVSELNVTGRGANGFGSTGG